MAADHLKFLVERFRMDLSEASKEFPELPLRWELWGVEFGIITPYTPNETIGCLYRLRVLLQDCVIMAQEESRRKQFDPTYLVKRLLFICKTRKELGRMEKRLKRLFGDGVQAGRSRPTMVDDRHTKRVVQWKDVIRGRKDEFHGFDGEFQRIKRLLTQGTQDDDTNKARVIGIVGMKGVGKTRLARLAVQSVAETHFSPIIWVRMPDKADQWDDESTLSLSEELSNAFSLAGQAALNALHISDTKCLIVIDNLYTSFLGSDPEQILFRKIHTGPHGRRSEFLTSLTHYFTDATVRRGVGAIIVTTTLQKVTRNMEVDEQHVIRLEPNLDELALWSIFWDSVKHKQFLTPNHRQSLLSMKDKIIHRCSGLPLAAKTLAEIISTQMAKEEYWSNSEVKKEVCLRVDPLDNSSVTEALTKVRTCLQGIDRVTVDESCYDIKIEGKCSVVEVTRELEKFFPVELISVGPKG